MCLCGVCMLNSPRAFPTSKHGMPFQLQISDQHQSKGANERNDGTHFFFIPSEELLRSFFTKLGEQT